MERGIYEESKISRLIEGNILLFSAAIIALFVDNINIIISLVGSTYCVFIFFWWPSAIYYQAITKTNKPISQYEIVLKYIAIFIFILGIFIFIFGITAIFM